MRKCGAIIINTRTGLTVTVGLQRMFLIDYSRSDLSDKVVKLHLDLHMHLAQGSFTNCLFLLNFFFFLAYLINHILWQLQAGILACADSFKLKF